MANISNATTLLLILTPFDVRKLKKKNKACLWGMANTADY